LNFHAIPPVRQGAKRSAPGVTLGPEGEEFIMNFVHKPKEMIRSLQKTVAALATANTVLSRHAHV
jgi:hypothetical protein